MQPPAVPHRAREDASDIADQELHGSDPGDGGRRLVLEDVGHVNGLELAVGVEQAEDVEEDQEGRKDLQPRLETAVRRLREVCVGFFLLTRRRGLCARISGRVVL